MANKNRNMIIAYFPSAYAADTAAQSLKAWDKATDAVKLGGTGILTWEDGKVKTHKVGARASGTGAKWGTILGATLGILSGGVTLIGGALVGAGAGAVYLHNTRRRRSYALRRASSSHLRRTGSRP